VAFSTAGGTSGGQTAYYSQLGGYWSYPGSAVAAAAAAGAALTGQGHLSAAGATPSYLHQQPYVASPPAYGYGPYGYDL